MGEINMDSVDLRSKCQSCQNYTPNDRHIVDGKPQYSCNCGETPDSGGCMYEPSKQKPV